MSDFWGVLMALLAVAAPLALAWALLAWSERRQAHNGRRT